MRYVFVLLCLLVSSSVTAQDSKVFSISSEGTVDLPADIIQFNINLNAEADAPQDAYNLHKKREEVLVQLLKRYDIEDRDINFEPISISKYNPGSRYTEQEVRFQTRQAVQVKLENFEVYETMQLALIEADFDSFSGSFTSSKTKEGKDRALRQAIATAKEKATLIADEAGVTLGAITGIDYSHNQERPVFSRSRDMVMLESSGGQLMDFEQLVTVTARISMQFEIQ